MPIRTAIWRVGSKPVELAESSLAKEQLLEDMIVAAPRLVSDEWMLIGRQEDTGYGGRIDLLAIAPDASLVLIELKRNRTPRDVVAQSLDYAGWVSKLQPDEIAGIYGRFAPGHSLAQDFRARFGQDLDEDSLNGSHQIVIVAASLDDSTERIVAYLSEREVPINVLCFQIFAHGEDQLLSRSWLLDPVRTQAIAATTVDGPHEPWNGEFYANFGHGEYRSWDEAVQYGFISAGGGSWYTKPLRQLKSGDRVWVKAPGHGFVGVGRVTGFSVPAADFSVTTASGDRPATEVLKAKDRLVPSDPDKEESFVPVRWLQTVPIDKAVQEVGMFGNQLTVCKPTKPKWRSTVERLKKSFPEYDKK